MFFSYCMWFIVYNICKNKTLYNFSNEYSWMYVKYDCNFIHIDFFGLTENKFLSMHLIVFHLSWRIYFRKK